MAPSSTVTSAPVSQSPLTSGVASEVTLPATGVVMVGAGGGVASMLNVRTAEARLALPATSTWVAVIA
jgi:hypothetical protein